MKIKYLYKVTEKPKIPESLADARPHNFQVTKNDFNHPQTDVRSPEGYVNKIIKDWMESITTAEQRQVKPEAWERYPEIFGHHVILHNRLWPNTLPVGFVLVSFLLSCYPRKPDIDHIIPVFNAWISSGNIREDLFDCFRRGEFFVKPDPFISPELDRKNLDGNDLGKSLYEVKQPDFFDDPD